MTPDIPRQFVEQHARVTALRAQLAAEEAVLRDLAESVVPEYLQANEFVDCYVDGQLITLEQKLHVQVRNDQREAVNDYLVGHGAEHCIKRQVTVQFGLKDYDIARSFEKMAKFCFPELPISVAWEGMEDEPHAAVAAIYKMAEEAFKGRKVTVKDSVPGPTLRSYVSKQLARGVALPECFGIFNRRVAVLAGAPAEEVPSEDGF